MLIHNDFEIIYTIYNMNILFNGGAVWGFCEYIGSLQYIIEHNLFFDRVYGVSAGSGIAALYVLGIDINDILEMWKNALDNTKPTSSLTENHLLGCHFIFNKCPDAYKIATGRLFIGITGEKGFFWKSKFTSNKDLGNALICGGTIPFFSSYDGYCDGKISIDGGFGITQSDIPKHTRVVNPITPLPISLIPPTEKIYRILRAIGYYNMRNINRKIKQENIEPCILLLLRLIQQYQTKQYSINDL